MSQKAAKHRVSFRDHLTAYLVLFAILAVIVLGAFVLYMTGIFDPVEITPALADAKPLGLATAPPPPSPDNEIAAEGDDEVFYDTGTDLGPVASANTHGLLSWLFPSALAEDAPAAQATVEPIIVQPGEAPSADPDLTALLQEIVAEEDGEEEITADQRVQVDKGDLALNENLPKDVYNVLLLATDSRDVNTASGRSDVMIIASLNTTANEIKLISLSRDMWVPLSNGAGNNKLNAAFAFGGPLLSLKTVNQNFDMNLEDYVVVNFATMATLVDSLGGVDIYLEGMEYAYINYNVAVSEDYEGFAKSSTRLPLDETDVDTTVHLDGLQAVSYARIRKLDSDFQRGSRQRILLQAMMDKGLTNLSLSSFSGMAVSMMNSVSTNVKLTTVMEIGTWLLSLDDFPSMNEMSIPVQGSYHSDTEKEMSVIKFNQAQNVQQLHEFIYGEYIPATAAQ